MNGRLITRKEEGLSSGEGRFTYLIGVDNSLIQKNEIKSIVTKEQFQNIEYRLEEK